MPSKRHQHSPSLAPALQRARLAAKLTQAQLSERAGLSRASILQVEAGRGRLDTLASLAGQIDMVVDGKGLPPITGGIGQRLADLRLTRGYSRAAVAAKAGISVPTVTAIDNGATAVMISAVEKYAAALGATMALVPVNADRAEWFKSSAYDAWTTPVDLARVLADAVGGLFDIDVASAGAKHSPIPARRYFTMAEDGLAQAWTGACFMNPPYGKGMSVWTGKAVSEVERGNARLVVGLLPANTDTGYWHDHIESGSTYRRFLRGRLKFGNAKAGATFGSVVVVWGGTEAEIKSIDDALTAWESSRNTRKAA